MRPSQILLAATFPVLVLFGLHYYLWARLVRDTGTPKPWRLIAAIALGLLGAALVGTVALMRNAPRAILSPLAWVGYLWLGWVLFGVSLLLAVDVLRTVAGRAVLPRGADPERRLFLAQLGAGVAVTGALGLSTAAAFGATATAIDVRRVRIALARLNPALAGFRIVQLSDLHVGPTIGRAYVEEVVRQVNALKPDLVAITGDLTDGSVAHLGDLVTPLRDLEAKHGVFFTTGNHEYYWVDPVEWFVFLETLGIRSLRNERVPIGGIEGFDLAGIDDLTARRHGHGHGADLGKALAGREPGRAVVLMAHHPRQVRDAQRLGVDLQLSGHMHGGQIFPFSLLVRLREPYIAGLYSVGGTQLYVSRGTGYWGPPMRLGAPAEITEIELAAV
jgi:predicted MPP superfamily phosphohydrolase